MYKDGNVDEVIENFINMLFKICDNKEFVSIFFKKW